MPSAIIEEYTKIRSVFLTELISRTFGITMEEVQSSDLEKLEEGEGKEGSVIIIIF